MCLPFYFIVSYSVMLFLMLFKRSTYFHYSRCDLKLCSKFQLFNVSSLMILFFRNFLDSNILNYFSRCIIILHSQNYIQCSSRVSYLFLIFLFFIYYAILHFSFFKIHFLINIVKIMFKVAVCAICLVISYIVPSPLKYFHFFKIRIFQLHI